MLGMAYDRRRKRQDVPRRRILAFSAYEPRRHPMTIRIPRRISAIPLLLALAATAVRAAETTVASLDNPNGTTTVAAGDTLIVTGNVSSTGDSNSPRFDKAGDGTLVLKGASNTFKRIKHSDGTLVFDGGTTTISGGSGTGADGNMNVLFQGDETIVTGGGSLILGSGNPFAAFRSRSMVVTNGTVDATAVTTVVLCNFKNGSLSLLDAGITTIGKDGKFRAKAMRPHQTGASTTSSTHGFRVVDGGILEITGANGLALDGAQYGMFLLDGGILLNSATAASSLFSGNWSNSPVTIGAKGATLRNGTQTALQPAVPFKSGAAADGGLHLTGKGFVNLNADGATYNGGTYLDSDDGMLLTAKSDSSLGTVPATPTDNIFVRGSDVALFANTSLALNANRNVAISSNRTFNVVAKNTMTLTIRGEINGAHNAGALPTTTCLAARRKWEKWDATARNGWVALDPGVGRTNNVGRLLVEGNLEIASGTTVIGGSGVHSYVQSNGTLRVSGGELVVAASSSGKFFRVNDGGTNDVCGGTVKLNGGEYLNAVNSGATIIRDGGEINCGGNFRMAQNTSGNPTVVRLATNGLLRCNQVSIDTTKNTVATFLFDGGYLHPTVSNTSFCVSWNNAAWDKITFAVGPGGAGFETEAGNNVWIYRPLVSGVAAGEKDGGLMVRGPAGTAVCLMTAQAYNGPTTIDTTLIQQRAGDNLLPAGTDIVLKNGGELSLWTYGSSARATAATLGGVSGNGTLKHLSAATFSGTFAPSIGGTIQFTDAPVSLSGTLKIVGDATGCGKVKFDQTQDISGLTLSVPDIMTFNKDAAKSLYKIVDGNYTGTFSGVSGLTDDWGVRYKADGVYLAHNDAFVLVVR